MAVKLQSIMQNTVIKAHWALANVCLFPTPKEMLHSFKIV